MDLLISKSGDDIGKGFCVIVQKALDGH